MFGLFKSSGKKSSTPRRTTDRYGKKGTWRKKRGSDSTSRSNDGKFKKKGWFK